jgi:hypothetical protein
MGEMTAAMRAVLDAADAIAASGVTPSLRAVARRTGFSRGWVQIQVVRLRAAGSWRYGAGRGGRPLAPKVAILPPAAPDPARERARRIALLKEAVRLRDVEKKFRTKFVASLAEWKRLTGHLIHGPDHGRPPKGR